MVTNKITYRLVPMIGQSARTGKRKPCWLLERSTTSALGHASTANFGSFDTIKEAKRFVQHLKRKPIEIG
jgi:hypothetical protein